MDIDSLFSDLISQDLSWFVMGKTLGSTGGFFCQESCESREPEPQPSLEKHMVSVPRVLKMVPVGELNIIKPQSNCQKCIGIVCRILSCTSAQVISTNAEYPLRLTL